MDKIKITLDKGSQFKSNTDFDSGYDVVALGYRRVHNSTLLDKVELKDGECVEIQPNETLLLTTGVKIELPEPVDKGDYYEIIELQARPRSGASLKEGKVVVLGTIDNKYRGEIGIILNNTSDNNITVNKGERISQLVFNVIRKYKHIEIVENLSETERGANGFGSSGK